MGYLSILNRPENIDLDGKAIAVCGYGVILGREYSCIVDLDRDICAGLDIGSQSGRHGIVDDIVVFCVARCIGNLGDGAELNGISDLVVAHNTPFTVFVMLDLLIQCRLIALRSCGHVSDNLHQVGCIEIVCTGEGIVTILDQIVTGIQIGNRIYTGSGSAHRGIGQI